MSKFKSDKNKHLMTRREIISLWSKSKEYLDSLCCPNCRDILYEDENGEWECRNFLCRYGSESWTDKQDGDE